MNIHQARGLLPVIRDSAALDGHTSETEASLRWSPKDHPEIVILGCACTHFHYREEVLPVLNAVRADPRYRGEHWHDGRFEFGDHVFDLEEMEALDTWIKYYAGPSLFM